VSLKRHLSEIMQRATVIFGTLVEALFCGESKGTEMSRMIDQRLFL
jgi:hypothetical protein